MEQEQTDGVWRYSCGQPLSNMNALGGHIARKKNKADHNSMGFVLVPKAAQEGLTPAQGNPVPVQNTSAPAEQEKRETKAQGKGKKLAVSGNTTGNFDQAAFLVVTPFVLYL